MGLGLFAAVATPEVDRHGNDGQQRNRAGGPLRLTVREGQAGFFTDAELDDSGGILWTPEEQEVVSAPRLDAPEAPCTRTSLSWEQLRAFSEGETLECFGPGFELARTHTRTPRIQGGDMLLLQQVTNLEREGGPWGRGYLRATWDFQPDD